MQMTLHVHEPLFETLQMLADEQGLTIEDMTRQALLAGVAFFQSSPITEGISVLGQIKPATPAQIGRMPSPVVCLGPLPPKRHKQFDSATAKPNNDGVLELGTIYPDSSLEAYVTRVQSTRVAIGVPIRQKIIAPSPLQGTLMHAD